MRIANVSLALPALLPLLASLLLGACRAEAQKPSGPRAPQAAPVLVAPVVAKAMPLSVRALGTVEPAERVAVRAQVGGILQRVGFVEGDRVSVGQLLFEIDPTPYEYAVKRLQAVLQRGRAQADNAAAHARRLAPLRAKGYATEAEYDDARTAAAAAEAAVQVDLRAIEDAKLQLSYTRIAAPLAGRTGSLGLDVGNLVRAGDPTPLVEIFQVHPIQVVFSVPAQWLPEVRRRAAAGPLSVRVDVPGHGPAEGKVVFVDPAVDDTTGTLLLKAEFANEDERLWPGQALDVELVLALEPQVLVVPSAAVQIGQTGPYAFVVTPDGKAQKRDLVVARSVAGETVVASGLTAGETVVVDGHLRVVPGGPVVVKSGLGGPAPAPAPAATGPGGGRP